MCYHYIAGHGGHSPQPWVWYGWAKTYYPLFYSRKIRPVPKQSLCEYPTDNPFMFDIAYAPWDVSSHYSGKPSRSNHVNRDGTAKGENMLFADFHIEWRALNRGQAKRFGSDYYESFYW